MKKLLLALLLCCLASPASAANFWDFGSGENFFDFGSGENFWDYSGGNFFDYGDPTPTGSVTRLQPIIVQ